LPQYSPPAVNFGQKSNASPRTKMKTFRRWHRDARHSRVLKTEIDLVKSTATDDTLDLITANSVRPDRLVEFRIFVGSIYGQHKQRTPENKNERFAFRVISRKKKAEKITRTAEFDEPKKAFDDVVTYRRYAHAYQNCLSGTQIADRYGGDRTSIILPKFQGTLSVYTRDPRRSLTGNIIGGRDYRTFGSVEHTRIPA